MMYKNGFSLIELIIVVAIIGILATIVYPSYSDYVQRANRADAKISLTQLAQRQERFFTENLQYATDFEALVGINGAGTTLYVDNSNGKYDTTESGQDYEIELLNATNTTYTLKASANSVRQLKDQNCLWFVIAHTGFQNATTENCWDR